MEFTGRDWRESRKIALSIVGVVAEYINVYEEQLTFHLILCVWKPKNKQP
jgi:hypothetical protein